MTRSNYILLFITSALFLIYLLIIFSCVRPVSDDLHLLLLLKNKGVAGSLLTLFDEWSFRWTPILFFNLLFVSTPSFIFLPVYIFFFYAITIILLVISAFYLLKRILPVPSTVLLCYAVILVAVIYFFTFQGSEVWFWIIASCAYLLTFLFTLLGFSVLLDTKKSWVQYGILIVCFTFIGGSVEQHAVTVLVLLGLTAIVARYLKNRFPRSVFSTIDKTKILVAAGVLMASLIFNESGQGIYKRLNKASINQYEMAENNPENWKRVHLTDGFRLNIYSAVMQRKNIPGLLLIISWVWLGRYYKKKHPNPVFPLKKTVFIIVLLMGVICFITILPLLFVFSNAGPMRAWSPISFFGSLALCIIFFQAGTNLKSDRFFTGKCLTILLLLTSIALGTFIYRHLPAVKKFARAYDERCEYLLNLEKTGNTALVTIEPLPTDNPLPVGDLSVDENNSTNRAFTRLLNLHFAIKVKDETVLRGKDERELAH